MNPGQQGSQVEWQWSAFDALDNCALYALLAARQQVFVIEQRCLYQDIDGIDPIADHLQGWQQHAGARQLTAYLRLLPPGVKFREPSLGRVLTVDAVRGTGVGHALIEQGLRRVALRYPGQPVRISAQLYLQRFYEFHGFSATSGVYDEDGIAHIEMLHKVS